MNKILTHLHPLAKKTRALENFLSEQNISIEFDGYHLLIVENETGISAIYRDSESNEDLSSIPHIFECKLVLKE